MPDIADDHATFREVMARAEAAAGITRDANGNEVYADLETPVVTPELEGAVPVAASDQPLETEPVKLPETDTSEQQQVAPAVVAPAVEPTAEELRSQLAVAEARLAEKDSFIGRQSGEVGELRQAIAEMQQQLASVAQPVTSTAPAVQITQELIDTNPAFAVQAAFEQKNEQALQIAFEAWKDPDTGDPFAASAWLYERKLEQQRAEFDNRFAEQQKRLEAVAAPLQESVEDRQWRDAFDEVKATRPDFLENAPRLLEEVAPLYPSFIPALQTGDAKAKAEALAALYALDKMGNPGAVKQQLEEAAQEAATEAAAARAAAGVVTGQTTAGQPSEEKTTEELEQEAYVARQRGKPSLSRGWTGRT